MVEKEPVHEHVAERVHSAAGSMRGHAVSEAKRQAASAMTKATKDIFGMATTGLAPPARKRKRR
jgi:hypothetical protein